MNAGNGECVLYVDDDDLLCELVGCELERLGFGVLTFNEPRDALRAFEATPWEFDAVVSDLSMPGMSGLELSEQILAIRPDIAVIILSGFVEEPELAAARLMGVRAILEKPRSIDVLGRNLAAWLRPISPQAPR